MLKVDMLLKAHERAFSVAQAMPVLHLAELRNQTGLLVATGASFREAKIALRPLSAAQA